MKKNPWNLIVLQPYLEILGGQNNWFNETIFDIWKLENVFLDLEACKQNSCSLRELSNKEKRKPAILMSDYNSAYTKNIQFPCLLMISP